MGLVARRPGPSLRALLFRCFACAKQRWQLAAYRATFLSASERQTDRQTDTDRPQTDRHRQTDRQTDTDRHRPDTDRHRQTQTDTDRHRQTQTDRDRQTDRQTDRHTHPHTHTHTPTYTPTHTQRHIHYMPHYSPDLPINASLRGPPCSGVYIYIYNVGYSLVWGGPPPPP